MNWIGQALAWQARRTPGETALDGIGGPDYTDPPGRRAGLSVHGVTLALGLVFAVLVGGCSTVRLSYDHADWLLARMAGRYVDLSADQSRLFRVRLTQLHAWHRVEELPRYADTFDEAADRLARGLTHADVDWAIGTVRARVRVLGEQAADDAAAVLATLSASQLRAMEQRFTRDNGKFAEAQLAGDPAQRIERRGEWLCERFEEWLGTLTAAQRARIAGLASAFPDMPALRLEERKRRQAVFLRLLRGNRSAEQLRPRLAAFLAAPDAGRTARSQQAMQAWERAFAQVLVDLDGALAPAQRVHAVAKLRDYAEQFRRLADRHLAARQAAARAGG